MLAVSVLSFVGTVLIYLWQERKGKETQDLADWLREGGWSYFILIWVGLSATVFLGPLPSSW